MSRENGEQIFNRQFQAAQARIAESLNASPDFSNPQMLLEKTVEAYITACRDIESGFAQLPENLQALRQIEEQIRPHSDYYQAHSRVSETLRLLTTLSDQLKNGSQKSELEEKYHELDAKLAEISAIVESEQQNESLIVERLPVVRERLVAWQELKSQSPDDRLATAERYLSYNLESERKEHDFQSAREYLDRAQNLLDEIELEYHQDKIREIINLLDTNSYQAITTFLNSHGLSLNSPSTHRRYREDRFTGGGNYRTDDYGFGYDDYASAYLNPDTIHAQGHTAGQLGAYQYLGSYITSSDYLLLPIWEKNIDGVPLVCFYNLLTVADNERTQQLWIPDASDLFRRLRDHFEGHTATPEARHSPNWEKYAPDISQPFFETGFPFSEGFPSAPREGVFEIITRTNERYDAQVDSSRADKNGTIVWKTLDGQSLAEAVIVAWREKPAPPKLTEKEKISRLTHYIDEFIEKVRSSCTSEELTTESTVTINRFFREESRLLNQFAEVNTLFRELDQERTARIYCNGTREIQLIGSKEFDQLQQRRQTLIQSARSGKDIGLAILDLEETLNTTTERIRSLSAKITKLEEFLDSGLDRLFTQAQRSENYYAPAGIDPPYFRACDMIEDFDEKRSAIYAKITELEEPITAAQLEVQASVMRTLAANLERDINGARKEWLHKNLDKLTQIPLSTKIVRLTNRDIPPKVKAKNPHITSQLQFSLGDRKAVIANKDLRGNHVPAYQKFTSNREAGSPDSEFKTAVPFVIRKASDKVSGLLFIEEVDVIDPEYLKKIQAESRGLDTLYAAALDHLALEPLYTSLKPAKREEFEQYLDAELAGDSSLTADNISGKAEDILLKYLG